MKKMLFLVTVLVSIYIMSNFAHSIFSLWKKHELLTKAEKTLEKEKKENKELKKRLEYVGSQDFVEKEARDKLFMVKEGETEIVLPISTEAGSAKDKSLDINKNEPNWKKWLNLFFEPI